MKLFGVVALAFLFLLPAPAHAIKGLTFGGLIIAVYPCPLSAGEAIVVWNINPLYAGTFVDIPTTFPYPFFINTPFSHILGDYLPVSTGCGLPARGTIIKKGTSAPK